MWQRRRYSREGNVLAYAFAGNTHKFGRWIERESKKIRGRERELKERERMR